MKMHIAAICFTERELDLYVSQLKAQGFESLSDVKKSDDGSYYQAMAKISRAESPLIDRPAAEPVNLLPV